MWSLKQKLDLVNAFHNHVYGNQNTVQQYPILKSNDDATSKCNQSNPYLQSYADCVNMPNEETSFERLNRIFQSAKIDADLRVFTSCCN